MTDGVRSPVLERPLVFMDTETTGLCAFTDEIWEVAAIRLDPLTLDVTLLHLQPEVSVLDADPNGDQFQRDRAARRYAPEDRVSVRELAQCLAEFTRDAVVIGAVPSFDTERLEALMHNHEVDTTWHYQPVDAETIAAGYLAGRPVAPDLAPNQDNVWLPPWDSALLSEALVVDMPTVEHQALPDAQHAARLFWTCMVGGELPDWTLEGKL